MCRNQLTLALALCSTLWFVSGAMADEQEIALNRVPAVVRQAAAKAVPGASWTKALKDTENGRTTYELEGKLGDGREVSTVVSAEGVVLEVETEIELAQIPSVVTAALRAKLPRFRPEEAVSLAKGGKTVGYEFEGKGADGKTVEVFVSADGRTLELDD